MADHDQITLTSGHGSIVTTVAIDEHLAAGVVSFTHGRADHSPGALTSSTEDIDPLTAIARASGIPLTVTNP